MLIAKLMTLMIIVCVFGLSGCATTGPVSNCYGWTPPPQVNNPVRMIKEERQLIEWVASTDAYGLSRGCWE